MKSVLIFTYLFLLIPTGALSNPGKLTPSYELVLVDARWPDRPFLVEISAKNSKAIKTFEAYIENGVILDAKGYMQIGIASGKVVHTQKTAQHAWNFRLDPLTVEFNDTTTEVCDSSFMGIENNIDNWIKQVGWFCPWSTHYMAQSIKKIWTK